MKTKAAAIASALVITGAIASIVGQGCGDSAEDTVGAARLARKGEACQSTADCVPGLACLPAAGGGGVCVLGAFTVAQTAKECAIIECTQAADCCDPPASCENDRILCDADAGTASQQACVRYLSQCVCDGNKRDCENGKCVVKCGGDSDCVGSGNRKCIGGKCRACATDADCSAAGPDMKCISAQCQPPCQGDGDCPGFERCLNGQCHQGACQTNRECIAATRNVEATCGTDGKCIIPCMTDLECGSPKNFKFFSCVSGQCLYLGCESDKDCRLALEGTSSSSSASSSGGFTPEQHIVCRDKLTPGSSTLPTP